MMSDRWPDRDPLRDILVEMGQLPAPKRRFSMSDIAVGWRVFSNERELIGRVAGREEDYLFVHRTFRGHVLSFWHVYVPASAIGQAREGAVLLNVPRSWIGKLGWSRPPRKPPPRWQHS
jgi:hypothetical protein